MPEAPSAFATWVQEQLVPAQRIVEFGFGNARDSLWFARQGHTVVGYDFAETAVSQSQGHADSKYLSATFFELDLYDASASALAGKMISSTTERPAIYGRFLIHSLEESGRHNLFDLAAATLGNGGEIYLEFRTGLDRGAKHLFGDDHFRVYLDPDIVIREIKERGGTILHSVAARGLAVYKTEDPHVARIVARWSDV